MKFRFQPIECGAITALIVNYYNQLPTHVDSFFEDRLLHAEVPALARSNSDWINSHTRRSHDWAFFAP
ncbi:MAG TPA: hypothetical protein DEF47_11015 [Herpetosiphon sp.]|uniref:hypothetical protein n=1 Tax=Herpetosiphon sp. TaxID=71864 RepID=UPI0002DF6C22|nr:hypothetical protein [Herpetosiphon sp.]HBW50427.1 hypothetical protein [Herpetosiphon sp.]